MMVLLVVGLYFFLILVLALTLALALALGVGGVGAVMRRYRGSARLTLVAVRLREEDSEESR